MINKQQAAKILGISYFTLRNWEKGGKISFPYKGKKRERLISEEELNNIKYKFDQEKKFKKCNQCKKTDLPNKFKKNKNICKNCHNARTRIYYNKNKEKTYQRKRKWFLENKERSYKTDKIRKYRITIKEYNDMIERCRERCQICNIAFKKLCIDHNHITNKVRGLLCINCNPGIGNFKESIKILYNAIKYLLFCHTKYCYKFKYNEKEVIRNRKYYLSLFEKLNMCEICEYKFQKLYIDHDHSNGRIRGLICEQCNYGLGHIKDSITNLGNAIAYLEENN